MNFLSLISATQKINSHKQQVFQDFAVHLKGVLKLFSIAHSLCWGTWVGQF